MPRNSTSSYAKVSRSRSYGGSGRGFRLRYSRRFSVQAFRTRFLMFFRFLNKWKQSYLRALRFVKRGIYGGGGRRISKSSEFGSSRRSMNGLVDFMPRSQQCGMRSLGRSNSFYSEAIADCLEFIKRSSVSSVSDKDEEEEEKSSSENVEGFQLLSINSLCKEKLELVS